MPIDELNDGRLGGSEQFGQNYDERFAIVRKYTQRMEKCQEGTPVASWGEASAEVAPNDYNSALTKVFEDTAAQYLAYEAVSYPIELNVQLPDVLVSIIQIYNKTKGSGTATDSGDAIGSGTSYSISLSTSAKSNSSLSTVADLAINIQQTWGTDIPALEYLFFIQGNQTRAALLTRLSTIVGSTVLAWPVFHPQSHTITSQSGQVSLASGRSAQGSVQVSGDGASASNSVGESKQVERGVSLRTTVIPPTLHGALTIGNPEDSDSITASAVAYFTSSTGGIAPRGSTSPYVPSESLALSVYPRTLAATVPADIPRTGYYLYHSNFQLIATEPSGKIFLVAAQVIDASVFQLAITDFVYSETVLVYLVGQTIEPLVPDHRGGAVASYSISPSLPTGLSLNTTTGVISGTVGGAGTANLTYTITATNAIGSTTTTITIDVN